MRRKQFIQPVTAVTVNWVIQLLPGIQVCFFPKNTMSALWKWNEGETDGFDWYF